MLTEQEVMAYINDRVERGGLKPGTMRLIDKMRLLNKAKQEKQQELSNIMSQVRAVEDDIVRLRGAISMLIELSAEEEGLSDIPNNSNTSDQ